MIEALRKGDLQLYAKLSIKAKQIFVEILSVDLSEKEKKKQAP